MAVSFLDITPRPASETVTIESASGPVDVELRGISFLTLAALVRRYSSLAQWLDGNGGDASEAVPAMIAAALGHPGEKAYEEKVREFPTPDINSMWQAVIRLTFPPDAAGPLPQAAPLPNGADGGGERIVTSLLPLNS